MPLAGIEHPPQHLYTVPRWDQYRQGSWAAYADAPGRQLGLGAWRGAIRKPDRKKVFERINARRRDLGILAAVVIDVESQTGIPALAGPISDEVNQWIDTAGGDVRIDSEIPLGIEIGIRIVSFEPASLQVMDQRICVCGDFRVSLPVPCCIEQGGRDAYSKLGDQLRACGRRGERLPKPEDSSGGDRQTWRRCSRQGRRVESGNKSASPPPESVLPAADGDRVREFLKE